jgi:hypothetical protein
MCDSGFNTIFTVEPWKDGSSGEDLTPFLEPLTSGCDRVVHPVTVCEKRCKEIAKAKHEECKMRVKQFMAYMKEQGCSGTWCSTKKKSVCSKRKKFKGKSSKKK